MIVILTSQVSQICEVYKDMVLAYSNFFAILVGKYSACQLVSISAWFAFTIHAVFRPILGLYRVGYTPIREFSQAD